MTTGVITLVVITSAGIFGFLSNAYQGATIDFEKQSATLLYKEERLVQLEEDKVYLKDELEQSISSLPENYPTAKRKLREEYNPKILVLNDEMLTVKQEIGELKVQLVETGVDVGPAIYLARTFETDIDTVVRFFIFILIFVFDPMAVSLIIAYNVIISNREVKRKKNVIVNDKKDIYIRKEMTNDKEEMTEEVEVVEEKVDTKPTEVPVKRIYHGGGGRTP